MIAGMKIERSTVVLMMLLLLWNVAGLIALAGVAGDSKSIHLFRDHFYMSGAAVVIASLLTRNTMGRLNSLGAGYIASAVIAGLAGISGSLSLFPRRRNFPGLWRRAPACSRIRTSLPLLDLARCVRHEPDVVAGLVRP